MRTVDGTNPSFSGMLGKIETLIGIELHHGDHRDDQSLMPSRMAILANEQTCNRNRNLDCF